MTKIEVTNLLKKRILAQKLNVKIFMTSYISMIFIALFMSNSLVVVILFIMVFPLIFFILVPYILNGYTIGGWLVGIQIVDIESKKISLKLYLKKSIEEFKFLFRKERYSVDSNYPTVKFYPINSRGQFYFDEKLNLIVRLKEKEFSNKDKVKYYEIEDLNKDFNLEGKRISFVVQNILYVAWFMVIWLFYFLYQ